MYRGFDEEAESENDAFPAADGGRCRLAMSISAAAGGFGKFGRFRTAKSPSLLAQASAQKVSPAPGNLQESCGAADPFLTGLGKVGQGGTWAHGPSHILISADHVGELQPKGKVVSRYISTGLGVLNGQSF